MKRSISVLIMVMMLFVSSFSMNIHGENLDEQAGGLDTDQTVTKLEIRPDTKDGKNKPIHAGGQVEYFLHVASSKTQIDSKNMKVKISIPRSFGNKGFVSQGTGDAIRGYVSYTEENIEITFTTSNLVGGSENLSSIPFYNPSQRTLLKSRDQTF